MIVTFYSYKGGVGRSMALVNVAELLADQGYHVIACDWDLEAPGLEVYFAPSVEDAKRFETWPGVMDLIEEYKTTVSPPHPEAVPSEKEPSNEDDFEMVGSLRLRKPSTYAKLIPSDRKRDGSIRLLTAGCRYKDNYKHYADLVQGFDWSDFYVAWAGGSYLEFFRKDLEKSAKIVLIDSRTGVTEHGGVCTHHLADLVVLMTACNELNRWGTLEMAKALKAKDLQERRGGRLLAVIPVASRVEQAAEKKELVSFRSVMKKTFLNYLPKELGDPKSFFYDTEIPYMPFYSFYERIVAREDEGDREIRLYQAYENLASAINTWGVKTGHLKPGMPKIYLDGHLKPEMPKIYLEWLINNYGYMEADKLHGKGQAIPLHLPEIFIPLYANEPEKPVRKADDIEARHALVDIEKLIAKNDYLLIEGQAGSGKTTLLKHLTYSLALQNSTHQPLVELHNVLPVLIFLKDLEDLCKDEAARSSLDLAAEDILAWYISNKIAGIIDSDTLNKFIQAQKAIFLLDGLDEVQLPVRDIIVNAFANLRIKNPDIKVVLTGRTHGMEGAVVNKFGAKLVRILPLNPDQVSMFIKKWFSYLYPGVSGLGSKNATAMISEIKTHPAINRMIDNPLMLTAICILYHDGRELPGQRAELYKKYIDNLLFRRFPAPEIVHEFLKTLAFQMHAERKRAVDRLVPTHILKDIYEINANEPGKDYKKRLDQIFNDIESKCGLLKFENGQYSFWHLTFQEFLAADYLVDNFSDHVNAIEKYWTDDWYKEVIELYIGYLSIEHRQTANEIISSAINVSDQPPYKRWRLAAQSMIDIHKNRRQTDVIDACRKQMLEIIASRAKPVIRLGAGESLGWLGELRELKAFICIKGDEYELEEIGKVNIDFFEIGKYPVINAWFEEFITAGGYQNKHFWSPEGLKWLEYKGNEQPLFCDQREWTCPNSPVVGISWYEAYAFTQWLTHERNDDYEYRLLTEVEWQAAAAGNSKRKYPWGKVWHPDSCNTMDSGIRKTSPVGIFEKGKTPEGLSDMSGNVWEWTCSEYHSGETRSDFKFDKKSQQLLDGKNRQVPVLRGGSWSDDSLLRGIATCADRFSLWPNARQNNVGFRCVRTKA